MSSPSGRSAPQALALAKETPSGDPPTRFPRLPEDGERPVSIPGGKYATQRKTGPMHRPVGVDNLWSRGGSNP